ncbi:MAG: 2-octaprenyl-6-methoxyphenyl hydroxylase [Gammaproteobacteria bacterium]|nr:2-octaprenyl-6-methoxyphenyl hydroxylase [Gammaproteobacteria bacterium]
MQQYDVVIVGGGMVGASLACALSGRGLRIAMVEAVQSAVRSEAGYDDRAIALAYGTKKIFTGLQLWDQLAPEATPIHQIHVSDRGHFGMARMDRADEGLPAIGYVVPARVIGQVLGEAVARTEAVDRWCPATVTAVHRADDGVRLDLACDGVAVNLDTRLIVAADGADSFMREQFGIGHTERDYGQTAIITNITPQLPHNNIAYERFTDTGPMALLPMTGQRCAVVWTVTSEQAESIMALDNTDFLARLQERFGYRLGRLEQVGRRQAWPLRLVQARESVRERLALVGNAVHTLHPVAGQGFNLGARDVAVLAEVLVDALQAGEDPGSLMVLNRYGEWRHRDHQNVMVFTDGLARLFTLPLPALGMVRSAGLLALDLLPPAKRWLTRMTMGRSGRTPKLARGLPL